MIATPPPVRYKKTVGLWRGDRRPEVAEMAMFISERKHHIADSRWSSRLAFSSVLISSAISRYLLACLLLTQPIPPVPNPSYAKHAQIYSIALI